MANEYLPPECSSVNFTFTKAYNVPDGCAVPFSFAESEDTFGILPDNGELLLLSTNHTVAAIEGLLIRSSSINTEGNQFIVDIPYEFLSDNSVISTAGTSVEIEILPDIIINPSNINIESDSVDVRRPEEYNLPMRGSFFNSGAWTKTIRQENERTFPFGDGIHQINQTTVATYTKELLGTSYSGSWVSLDWKDNTVSIPNNEFKVKISNSSSDSWEKLKHSDDIRTDSYYNVFTFRTFYSIQTPYNQPDPNDVLKKFKWEGFENNSLQFSVNYDAPSRFDSPKCIPWGPFSYYTLCNLDGKYTPPAPCSLVSFNFPNEYELLPNVCKEIKFILTEYSSNPDPVRCPYTEVHTGIRDKYPGIEVGSTFTWPTPQKVYYMFNQVLVRELITGHPIEVFSITATIDRDSWLWQFSLTVSSRDCLEIIKPKDGVFVTIVIHINGYEWNCTVEGWSENRQYGNDSWTVTGRSPSILFGEPIARQHTNTVTEGKTGGQLFDDLITLGTNDLTETWPASLNSWDSDWTTYDSSQTVFNPYAGESWYVPGNTLTYSDQRPIDVMKTITGAIGAYIQTEPNSNILSVKPIYSHQPWNWTKDNSDINWKPIIEHQCTEIARNYEFHSYYYRVYVMGESIASDNTGLEPDPDSKAMFVHVYRNGGQNLGMAPMITNSLITTPLSAVENGRMLLGNSGEWVKHTLKLSVLCPPTESMGLFKPGDMITVFEKGAPWYGQVTGTSIVASMSGSSFTVNQVLNVEQHIRKEI